MTQYSSGGESIQETEKVRKQYPLGTDFEEPQTTFGRGGEFENESEEVKAELELMK